ncbi:MAG: PD40 domain-containing protein [Sedimentisphaerales bacterium]|nr:PD40 domain-containing protein [Sedimentisphaerales bacterium]
MMICLRRKLGIALLVLLIGLGLGLTMVSCNRLPAPPATFATLSRPCRIRPDYSDLVIPPNIAPLNFAIQEPGNEYLVQIHGAKGRPIAVYSKNPDIIIPMKDWNRLLQDNRGDSISVDIYTADTKGQWTRYQAITNTIAKEPIDSHLAYRFLKPNYNYFKSIRVNQRNLEGFQDSTILDGRSYRNGCVNCHTFLNGNPDTMAIGIRSSDFGSSALIADQGEVVKIGAKWGYTSWHPSGKLAVYAVMKVRQFFHTAREEVRDVIDLDSGLFYYKLDSQTVGTDPGIADKERLETYPTWSPDGKYLYFCSAPFPWEDRNRMPPDNYDQLRYDLRRISYDVEKDAWGRPETILSAEQTGKSAMLPRISPDGRFLVFCLCDYGCFPIYQDSSDLYLMDLETRQVKKLEQANSDASESWHSFSSNGRWLAFSSRRMGGPFTRLFFCYLDEQGKACKPFLLPQKDPHFYDACLETFSVPELITGPVAVSRSRLIRAVRNARQIQVDATTGATPTTTTEPWKQQ